MTHLPKSGLGFPLPRERGQDFGWGFAASCSSKDCFDGVCADNQTASVEPIPDVGLSRDPLKVIGSCIKPVFVPVVNDRQIQWIGNEGISHKPMDQRSYGRSVTSKLNFWVSSAVRSMLSDARADESALVGKSVKAQDAPQIAYSVEPLISSDVPPFLSRQVGQGFSGLGKEFENCSLQVEFLSNPPNRTQVNNQISVDGGELKHSGLAVSPAIDLACSGADAATVRQFIKFLKARNWLPSFSDLGGSLYWTVCKKLVSNSVGIYPLGFAFARQGGSTVIKSDHGARSGASRVSDLLGSCNAPYSAQIRNLVQSFVPGNRVPFFVRLFHWFAPAVVTSSKGNNRVSQWFCQRAFGHRHNMIGVGQIRKKSPYLSYSYLGGI